MKKTILLFCLLLVPGVVLSAEAVLHPTWGYKDDSEVSWKWLDSVWPQQSTLSSIRAEIEAEAKSNTLSQNLLRNREQAFLKDTKDPALLFRWAYTAWILQTPQMDDALRSRLMADVFNALRSLPVVDDYEYFRLRFLVESQFHPQPKLSKIGIRLLQKNKDDFDVKYLLAYVLSSGDQTQRDQSLTYIKQLLDERPTNLAVIHLMGSYYLNEFIESEKVESGVEAQKYFKKYLDLSPSNYYFRNNAKYIVEQIERDIARLKAEK